MFNFNQLYYQLSYCMPAQHPRWLGLGAKLIDGIRILMKMPSSSQASRGNGQVMYGPSIVC